jgi:hypothetical protein
VKLPFEFGTPLIFRLALPGVLLALLTFSTTRPLFSFFTGAVSDETLIAFQAVVYGWLIVIADMHIYMLFEGRRYWPVWLSMLFVKDERRRLAGIRRRIKNLRYWPARVPPGLSRAQLIARNNRYLEASVDGRDFPIDPDNGKHTAELPTRLGNILLAFEGYPERVYGLDAIFYWPRLWQMLDKDLREELNTAQAMTDSALYVSFVLYVGAVVLLIRYVIVYYLLDDGTAAVSAIGLLGGGCLAVGYVAYRVCLHLHTSFGEMFKAAFDVFGDQIDLKLAKKELAAPLAGASSKAANLIIWRYLHNYRVKDPHFPLAKRPAAWSRKFGPLDTPSPPPETAMGGAGPGHSATSSTGRPAASAPATKGRFATFIAWFRLRPPR